MNNVQRLHHGLRTLVRLLPAMLMLAGIFASSAIASGPPGPDWKETSRYIIFKSKTKTVWLVWYRREARMVSSQRIRALGMSDVLAYLGKMEGQENVNNIIKGFGPMMETELKGLGHVCRGYMKKENTTRAFEDVIDLPPTFRNHLFHLVGELSEKATIGKGLANAIDRGLVANNEANQMGLIGQLRAAQQFARKLVAAGTSSKDIVIDFEVPKIIGEDFREVDLRVTVKGRRTDVEVKTNMGGEPSRNRKQIRKDILAHLDDDWKLLIYLYPRNQEGNLHKVRKVFLQEFDAIVADAAAKRIANPFTAERSPEKLRTILENRLPTLVSTFKLPDMNWANK